MSEANKYGAPLRTELITEAYSSDEINMLTMEITRMLKNNADISVIFSDEIYA